MKKVSPALAPLASLALVAVATLIAALEAGCSSARAPADEVAASSGGAFEDDGAECEA